DPPRLIDLPKSRPIGLPTRCGAEKSKNRPDAAWTSKTERSKHRNNSEQGRGARSIEEGLRQGSTGRDDMASMKQKIGVIGVGAVGSASLLSTVLRGVAREIVVVNREPKRARGGVADVQYGAALSPAVDIRAGDYEDVNGADLVMIAAGANEKAGGAT